MKLSICCLTYNHGKYLEEAIKSFVSQKTSFDFEIVIGDDASTDGTLDLINGYSKNHSNIRYYRQEKNIGMMANAVYTLKQCTGELIALCEGDDYWIDPLKLEMQVKFLETNKQFAICFTGTVTKNEMNDTEDVQIPPSVITIEELIKQNRFDTATAVFPAQYITPIPEWFRDLPFGDWATYLTVLHRSKKKAACLQEITAVRRLHQGGIYTSMNQSHTQFIKSLKWDIEFYKKMQVHLFKDAYYSLIDSCIKRKERIVSSLLGETENETALLSDIINCIPANGSFILVDDWYLNLIGEVNDKKVLPFTEQNGVFWGRPADDASAIAEIERQHKSGVSAMVFTWQAFWWLEHYTGMCDYLEKNYKCIVRNDCLIGFDLQQKHSIENTSFEVAENVSAL